jgi:hypothetical protein
MPKPDYLIPIHRFSSCGAVGPGDELLAIDGISLELVGGLVEAYQLLRSQSAILRLELIPAVKSGAGNRRCAAEELEERQRQRLESNRRRNVQTKKFIFLQQIDHLPDGTLPDGAPVGHPVVEQQASADEPRRRHDGSDSRQQPAAVAKTSVRVTAAAAKTVR